MKTCPADIGALAGLAEGVLQQPQWSWSASQLHPADIGGVKVVISGSQLTTNCTAAMLSSTLVVILFGIDFPSGTGWKLHF